MMLMRSICMIVCLLLAASWVVAAGERVLVAKVNGAIGPATAGYIARAVEEASSENVQCLIVELDTPGGLLESTKQIVQSFLGSPVPIVVYVTPSGATATSAGCFIVIASDVAAMAPATSIGAAHPVQIGPGEGAPEPEMKKKLENYAASYIETIAARRGRNAQWATSAVRDSASISADKALEMRVIEIIAPDLPDLLKQLDGRQTHGRMLATANAKVAELPMTLRENIFQRLWGPEVMFILMLITVYGIIGELSSPGAILPGVAGGISLVLLLYMAAVLPINMAGLALILLAIGLFIADAFAPTHGVLTFGGTISFALGSFMMFDRAEPMLRLSLWLIVPATLCTAAFFLFVVTAGLRAQFLSVKTGKEAMIGQSARAITAINPHGGKVRVEGEYWNARSDTPITEGALVRIVAASGLLLTVEPEEEHHG